MIRRTDDLRIREIRPLIPPAILIEELAVTGRAASTVAETRAAASAIIRGSDRRLVAVVGPCSIHDPRAALEFAERLRGLAQRFADDLVVVMRAYFEKPRTTVGWKGLINDPNLDGTFEINTGLKLARGLLLELNELGLPAGTEFLDLISPQYIADLVSWGAIGARTTESQGHRELASGLSCPVGFKNSTDGSLGIAIDAIRAARRPHVFMSVTKEGRSAIFSTAGNDDTHVILRGGSRPNYDTESVNMAAEQMDAAGLQPRLMIDFSHANSRKRPEKQVDVGRDVAGQIARGDRRIIGVMVESHLVAGRQDVIAGKPLTYGQSITDACIGWDDSVPLLHALAAGVRERRTHARRDG